MANENNQNQQNQKDDQDDRVEDAFTSGRLGQLPKAGTFPCGF